MILAEEGTKMSKSRGTQIAPDELVERHGADALRCTLCIWVRGIRARPWNSRGITGMERFIRDRTRSLRAPPAIPMDAEVREMKRSP